LEKIGTFLPTGIKDPRLIFL